MNNTAEIPADVMKTAPEAWFKAIGSDSSTAGINIIAQALLAAQIQGLRMAAAIADSLCETTGGYDPTGVAIMDAITKAADKLNGTHTGKRDSAKREGWWACSESDGG